MDDSFTANFSRPLNGGVLIIGSLLWQDDSSAQPGDQARKHWRETFLVDKSNRLHVKAPIRYGRYSKMPVLATASPSLWELTRQKSLHQKFLEDISYSPGLTPTSLVPLKAGIVSLTGGTYGANPTGAYTMVISRECDEDPQLQGRAWVYPFQRPLHRLCDAVYHAYAFAYAEGINKKKDPIAKRNFDWHELNDKGLFLSKSWGMITLLVNPKCPEADKVRLLAFWKKAAQARNKKSLKAWQNEKLTNPNLAPYVKYHERFNVDKEDSCLTAEGTLNINPLKTLDDKSIFEYYNFDFILATVTAPQLADDSRARYPTVEEIGRAAQTDPRRYWSKNQQHNIITFQDLAIKPWVEPG